MYSSSFATEYEVARRVALEAGEQVMKWYGRASAAGSSARSPVTEADRESNRVITNGLAEAFPADSILSEESPDDPSRLRAGRVWIIDPLDGTKEFLSGNGEFSIMIGLAISGTPVLGVIYVPATATLFGATWGAGAWMEKDGEVRRLKVDDRLGRRGIRLVTSRSHPDPLLTRICEELHITNSQVSGSVGVKCAMIAQGASDLYIHPSPFLKEWDCCAPDLFLREAGGSVTDCYGDPLRYNKVTPSQPSGLVASGPEIIPKVLSTITPLFAAKYFPTATADSLIPKRTGAK